MDKSDHKYIFTVIVPIYNVAEYLEEALKSITDQTIGFSNIQLVLVNDGSPDDSYKICEKYQERYPDNVLYIVKENGGVSSARNEGLRHAAGEYIVFLDGDDFWDRKALKKIADFFEENGDAFDVCSCRIKYSGDFKDRIHPLDYKFESGVRVVDLQEDPLMVSSTIGNSVVRRSAIGTKEFRVGLSVGEDSEFVNTILLNKPVLGINPDAVFYYRRNIDSGSGSSSATKRKSWYLDVPREYYGSLCGKSVQKYGKVLPFIQHVILYDMRWRFNKPYIDSILTEEEIQQYVDILHQTLKDFDPGVIKAVKGLDQYRKLYYLNLKYGKSIIEDAELIKHRYYYNETPVLDFRRPFFFDIAVIEIENGYLRIEGLTRASATKRPYSFFAAYGKKRREIKFQKYNPKGIEGYAGETLAEFESFEAFIPAKEGRKISFYIKIDGKKVRLAPSYKSYICHTPPKTIKRYENSYCVRGDYIIKCQKKGLVLCKYSRKTLIASEARLAKEISEKDGLAEAKARLAESLLQNHIRNCRLRNRVVFISVRSDGVINENAKGIYDILDVPKAAISRKNMHTDPRMREKAAKLVYSSKVVVTDDYLFLFREYGKKKGQKFVQLWHATGAGKRFGKDGGFVFAPVDRLYHKDYDLVTVSGEASRTAFASAFNIPADVVQPVGVARTDIFFDEKKIEATRSSVLRDHPELADKQVILYAPTFRDIRGVTRDYFVPDLDFDKLSEELLPDQIFVIKPHPVMTKPILHKSYDNIIELRDIGTNDIMIVSDILITDYSSIFFEYALMKKPIAFFCYDYDEYDRDFYIDYEHDLPGPVLKTQEELFEYLRKKDYLLLESYEEFYDKYMGACDGHSTERIASIIKGMLLDE